MQVRVSQSIIYSIDVNQDPSVSPIAPIHSPPSPNDRSDPKTDWKSAEQRLLQQRARLASRAGLRPDAVQPEFCRQNDGYCFMPKKKYPDFPPMPEDDPLEPGTGADTGARPDRIGEALRAEGGDWRLPPPERGRPLDVDPRGYNPHRHPASTGLSYVTLLLCALLVCLVWLNRRVIMTFVIPRLRGFGERHRRFS